MPVTIVSSLPTEHAGDKEDRGGSKTEDALRVMFKGDMSQNFNVCGERFGIFFFFFLNPDK
jgi:hypothetical protein